MGKVAKETSTNHGGTSFLYNGEVGNHECQFVYPNARRSDTDFAARSGLPSRLLFDYARVLQVITEVDPPSSTFCGGGRAMIRGSALDTNVQLFLGL